MNDRPLVSIIVAVYNVGEYIQQCARSLFSQTLVNIEIIFVDDSTPDNSVEIIMQTLEEYPNRANQVHLIHHEHNMGLPQTRLDGLKKAQSEYVLFVDGDDYVEPKYAESLYNKASETDADMVIFNYYHHYSTHTSISRIENNMEATPSETLRNDQLNRRIPHFIWCRLFRKRLFDEHQILWPQDSYAEDLLLTFQTTFYAHKLAYVTAPLYHYRYNAASFMHADGEDKAIRRFNGYMANYKLLIDFMQQNGIMEQYENTLFITKIAIKNLLLPVIAKPQYYWKFFNTFPEINWLFLVGNKRHRPSWHERVWIIAIALGLYPLLKKKLSANNCPRKGWRP